MIVVTGATGLLGGAVVERLLARQPAEEIGVSVRDPAKAQALADRGVRVRRGDYDDAASLAHAFDGAGQILSSPPRPPARSPCASTAPRSTRPARRACAASST